MNKLDEWIIMLRYKFSVLIVKVMDWIEANTGIK